jgi:hypothetical protein
MSKSFTVKARLEAEDKASSVVEKVEGRFSRLGSFLSSRFVITLGDVTRAVKAVAGVFGDMIEASAEAEKANKALDASLAGLGSGAAAVAAGLREQAAALQQTTRFEDDAIVSGQALLAIYTQNEAQLRASTQAAVDFAAATGTDLQSAFSLLAKAAAGSTESLSRYGIIIDDNIPQAEKFEAVLAKMNAQFGGRAAADVETFSGVLAQLGNAFGELQESAGNALTQNEQVVASLQRLKDVLQNEGVKDSVTSLSSAVVDLGASFTANLISGTAAWIDLLRAWRGDQEAANRLLRAASGEAKVWASAAGEAADAQEKLAVGLRATNSLMESHARFERETAEAAKGFAEAVHALGVTLEDDVNVSMERNERLMEQAEELYRRGAITRADFERVQRGVADANDEATASLLEQVDAFDELTSATGSSAEGFETFRRSVRDTRSELDGFSSSSQRAADSQSKFSLNATGGRSSFATISGGKYQVAAGSTFYYDSNYNLRVRS